MHIIRDFITTYMECISIFILWDKFSLSEDNAVLKKIFIITVTSFVTAICNLNVYLNMIFSYLTIILLVSFLYKKKFIRTGIEFSIILFCIILFQLISSVIIRVCIGKYPSEFLFNIIGNLLVLICSICICYFIPVIREVKINWKIISCIVVNFMGYIVILKVIWNYDRSLILDNIIKFIIIISLTFVLNLCLYWYIDRIQQEKKDIQVQVQYNKILKNITEELRERQHDFKNHLNIISGLADVTGDKELRGKIKEYIGSLNESMINIEDIIYIDNPILRAIIYDKLNEATSKKVEFSYIIQNPLKDLSIKNYEISEILNNLIDNAFEALESESVERKVIVKTYFQDGLNIIEIMNSGMHIQPENIKKMFERGFSTKSTKGRGYGLYNVKKIVERNGGKIQLSLEMDYTVFRLFIH